MSAMTSSGPLVTIGGILRMGVLCRPSQVVRSPYVADIQKSPFDVSPFASVLKGEGAKLTGKEKSERK